MTTITLHIDLLTRKAKVDVPEPPGGPLEPVERNASDGSKYYVFAFGTATREQLAYYVFWDNGTQARIDAICSESGKVAGVTRTLSWLVQVRMCQALLKTGFKYELEVLKEASKASHKEPVFVENGTPGWLYDKRRREFLKPASYEQLEEYQRKGYVIDGTSRNETHPTKYVLRHKAGLT